MIFLSQKKNGESLRGRLWFQNLFTPVKNMTKQEALDYYHAMGPPYIAKAKDMYAMVNTWSDINSWLKRGA
jgi:hypothetical protein